MNPKDLIGAKKSPLGVVPPSLLPFVAPAMAVGANKYGPFNWRAQKVQAMTYLEAAERHILAFIDGQESAEDTGVHHLSHAIAGLAILADAITADNWIDNRPSPGPTPDILRAQDKSLTAEKLAMNAEVGRAMQRHPLEGSRMAAQWGPGLIDSAGGLEGDAITICEDSGNHVPGRHLLSCPDFS